MRKQEYVHVHALFVEITTYLIEQEAMPPDALAAYEALDARPCRIHEKKKDHRDAIVALASGIERWIEQEPAGGLNRSRAPAQQSRRETDVRDSV